MWNPFCGTVAGVHASARLYSLIKCTKASGLDPYAHLRRVFPSCRRLHPAKHEVLVHDHVDEAVPALRRIMQKRIRGYSSLGYSVEPPPGESMV